MEKVREWHHTFKSCVVKKHWWIVDPDVSHEETGPETGRTAMTSLVGQPGGTLPMSVARLGIPLCKASSVQPGPLTPHKPQERLLSKDVDNFPFSQVIRELDFKSRIKDYTGESVSKSLLTGCTE